MTKKVSMKSGLEGRNNIHASASMVKWFWVVSMKSGLEGRNNPPVPKPPYESAAQSQ